MASFFLFPSMENAEDEMSPPISPYEGNRQTEKSTLKHHDSLDIHFRLGVQYDGYENNTIEGNEKKNMKIENELDVYDNTLLRRIARIPLIPGLRFNLGMGVHLGKPSSFHTLLLASALNR
jgi:hypothetical protein